MMEGEQLLECRQPAIAGPLSTEIGWRKAALCVTARRFDRDGSKAHCGFHAGKSCFLWRLCLHRWLLRNAPWPQSP